jgi:hypothetical protein
MSFLYWLCAGLLGGAFGIMILLFCSIVLFKIIRYIVLFEIIRYINNDL